MFLRENKMTIAYSPCPNDTFIFDALINRRIESEFAFDVNLADVEVLNRRAWQGFYDISKVSVAALPLISDKYELLDSGAALGFGCGPLLVSRENYDPSAQVVNQLKIAIPGQTTTANLLMKLAYQEAKKKEEVLFSEIEDSILRGQFDAGVIIHESRFTYEQKGLRLLRDLGEFWESTYGVPLPLGCIVIRKDLPESTKRRVERLIRESVEFAFANPEASAEYVAAHAAEMDPEVRKSHIGLYVNQFSVSLGEKGKAAISTLLGLADGK